MKHTLLSALILMACTTFGQKSNPFLTLKYDRVMVYELISSNENAQWETRIIDEKGNFLWNIIDSGTLDEQTVRELNSKIGLKKSYGNGNASCFDPHFGLVYYLKDEPVAQVSVCLNCNRLYSTIEIPGMMQGKKGKGKNVYYTKNGMSKSFRKYINGIIQRYEFSVGLKEDAYFDR
jgi:hypothetical protein